MSRTTTSPVPTTFNPSVPHCMENADNHFDPNRKDGPITGGGYMTCLAELRPDGSCPNANQHYTEVIKWRAAQTTCSPGHHLGTCTCGAAGPSKSDLRILESSNMTANVQTRTGSRYTVVARPNVGVVLIHDDKGWAAKGAQIVVLGGRLYMLNEVGRILAQTTSITGVYIMSN